MKKTFTLLPLLFISIALFAQDKITEELQVLYDDKKFDKIISDHAADSKKYPAEALYIIGRAYYQKEDDKNCIKFMDLAIEKNPSDPESYFSKGLSYNYLGQFEKAIPAFKKSIELDDSQSRYYSALGDSYFNLEKLELALEAFKKATTKEHPSDRPFTMIPQIYAMWDQKENALKAFYLAKEKINKKSDSYLIALYNIGLFEYLDNNYKEAENAYLELLEFIPDDYQTYAKLIQCYYGLKQYEKADPYKQKLYTAYEKGVLEDNLKDMFCFDQFVWEDRRVHVYEKFAEPEGELYYKHVFYVLNDKSEILFQIQTENSVMSQALGGPKYLLGQTQDGAHSTFNYGIEEDFEYDKLKQLVIKILDGKIKPGATSIRGSNTDDD